MNNHIKILIVLLPLILFSCSSDSNESLPGQTEKEPVNWTHFNFDECLQAPSQTISALSFVPPSYIDATWSYAVEGSLSYSSPRVVDLNGDGVLDILQGFAQDPTGNKLGKVFALDGTDGSLLWSHESGEGYFSSGAFAYLNNDDVPDIIFGGRGNIVSLNGVNGSELWSHYRNFGEAMLGANFMSAQILLDQNFDGVNDVLATSGGGNDDSNNRIPGEIFVFSGLDGSLIVKSAIPNDEETYTSPITYTTELGENTIVFGSGGETLPGSLWTISMSSLLNDSVAENSVENYRGTNKGVIAPAAAADFNGDCVKDLVSVSYDDGTILGVNGATNNIVWSNVNVGYESFFAPTLGYFVGDDSIPDIFIGLAKGVYPLYESAEVVLIDGSNGVEVWRETVGRDIPSGAAAADLNADGRDEVIMLVNREISRSQLLIFDTVNQQVYEWGEQFDQLAISAPYLGDLDKDGLLELVFATTSFTGTSIYRHDLNVNAPDNVSWSGYLGTYGDGVLH